MYKHDFKVEDNMDDVSELILQETDKKIGDLTKKFNEEIFTALSNDIESWLFERFDNVRWQYFNNVSRFLLGESKGDWKENLKLNEWLSSIGYTQQTFRKKIYEDNKEIINEAITYDAVYESLENMFSHKFFKSWEFKDITANYPQTTIIREFLRQLIQKDGFNNEVKSMLDKDITNKMEELKNLNNRIESIKQQIEDIT